MIRGSCGQYVLASDRLCGQASSSLVWSPWHPRRPVVSDECLRKHTESSSPWLHITSVSSTNRNQERGRSSWRGTKHSLLKLLLRVKIRDDRAQRTLHRYAIRLLAESVFHWKRVVVKSWRDRPTTSLGNNSWMYPRVPSWTATPNQSWSMISHRPTVMFFSFSMKCQNSWYTT